MKVFRFRPTTTKKPFNSVARARYQPYQAKGDLGLASGGALFGLGRFGVLSLNASVSNAETGLGTMSGGQLATGYELIDRPISFNFSATEATAGYRDIAARAGDPPIRSSINALVGIELKRFGSLSLGINRGNTSAPFGPQALAFEQRSQAVSTRYDRTTLVSATYSASVGRGISLYANCLRDLDRRGSTIAILGVTMVLGKRATASGSITSQDRSTDANAQLFQPVTAPGDFGYRVQANTGVAASVSAQAEYEGSWGDVNAGLESVRGQVAGRAGMRGSIVLADGGLLVGNTLDNSFAIVDSGLPDVAVTRDRPTGRTNAQGRLLVPDLRAYESNLIAIDPLSLDDDALPAAFAVSVTPADRVGVVARFAAHHVRAARVRLVDALGVPLPPESRATLNGSGASVPVGYDGEVYLNRAATMIALKRYDDALKDADRAVQLHPVRIEVAYYNRAMANEALGNVRAAYEDYSAAVQAQPRFTAAKDQLSRFHMVRSDD